MVHRGQGPGPGRLWLGQGPAQPPVLFGVVDAVGVENQDPDRPDALAVPRILAAQRRQDLLLFAAAVVVVSEDRQQLRLSRTGANGLVTLLSVRRASPSS